MITILPETSTDALIVKASGKLSMENYEKVFIPALEKLIEVQGQISVLIFFDDSFEGWEIGAMWDDAKFGLKHVNDFKKLAVVGASALVDWGARVGAHLMSGEVKTFASDEFDQAVDWVKA